MKNLTVLCLLFFSFGSSAQIQVTDSLIESFLEKTIVDINQKIYQAALDGTIEVYWSDSFNSPIPKNELKTIGSYESIDTTSPEPNDSIILKFFDWSTDVKGFKTVYTSQTDVKLGTISYQLQGVGPIFMQICGEGVELGLSHLFLAKRNTLPKVFSSQELKLTNSLAAGVSQFGDFRVSWLKYFEATAEEAAAENARRSILSSSEMIHNRIDFTKDPMYLATYLQKINSTILYLISSSKEHKYQIEPTLFFDKNLTICFDEYSLNYDSSITEDEIGFTTDYVFQNRYLSDWSSYKVYEEKDEVIFDFTLEKTFSEDDHIYVSFNSIKALYPEHDRIVMEAFFKYLFEE